MAGVSNNLAQCEAIEENTNPQVFVPSDGARYRPMQTKTGIEGTFLHKKKPKKAAVNVNKNMHVGLGRELKEA